MEEGVGIPPAGSRGEHLLQTQNDHWRSASIASSEVAGSRSGYRVQHPESDVRTGQTKVVRCEVADWHGRADVRGTTGFMHQRPKTPRNRGNCSGCAWMDGKSLCPRRLNGGGRSLGRTRLRGQIPVKQGKYREFLRFQTPRIELGLRFPSVSAVVASNSL